MKTVAYIKQKFSEVHQPVTVEDKEWRIAQSWALEACKSKAKGQYWSHQIELPYASCITWFLDEQGECTVGDWTNLSLSNYDQPISLLERMLNEFVAQREWFDAAESALVLAIITEKLDYWVQAGSCMRKAGQLKGALQVLGAGVKLFPSAGALYAAKSKVYQELGWIDHAIDQLETALAFEPVVANWWSIRAELQCHLGQRGGAIRSLKHACTLPSAGVCEKQKLANLLLKTGAHIEANRLILSLQKEEPTNGMNWLLLARWACSTNESEKYVKEYYQIARDLGVKSAQSEMDYYLVRQAQKARKRVAA